MKNKKENKKHIKKFQKARFDFAKYVREFYVENGKAYISVKVDSINDIISEYSIKGSEWLNRDFVVYVEENTYYIPVIYPIVIDIYGCNFTEEQQKMITEVIRDYFGLKLGDKILELKQNRKKAVMLLLFGITTLVISLLLSSFDDTSMLFQVIVIVSWFAIWEFVSYVWFEREQMNRDKLEAGQLASMEVKFNNK
ncbi:MAG: hypothetical protein ACM3O4_06040 [Ignavibacteriales bacterium]